MNMQTGTKECHAEQKIKRKLIACNTSAIIFLICRLYGEICIIHVQLSVVWIELTGRNISFLLVLPEDPPDGLRRSQRVRCQPVAWYKGERLLYERRKSGKISNHT